MTTTSTKPTTTEIKTSKKRKRNHKASVPKPGEPGYKTPTQLRNERKRRARKQSGPDVSKANRQTSREVVIDPSSQYLENPKAAPIVRKAMAFFKSLNQDFDVHVGAKSGWRTVAKLAVRAKDGTISIGLFAPNSHDLLPVPNCVAHHPSINSAVAVLEQLCQKHGVQPFEESTGSGYLRHVAINVERSTGKVQITLVWNSQPHKDGDTDDNKKVLDSLTNAIVAAAGGGRKRRRGRKGIPDASPVKTESLKEEFKLHSLWVHFNASWKHSNAIFSIEGGVESWKHLHGPKFISEVLSVHRQPTSIALHFPPNVFRQANLDAFANIVNVIRKTLSSKFADSKPSCVELYGGVGTIGLNLADLTSRLISSDENPFNKECFLNAATVLSDASNVAYESKNATAMVQSKFLEEGQVIVVDPPRKGLDQDVLTALCCAKAPEMLVYVSCGFDAFERDCAVLLKSGWKLDHAEGHLLFPGSDAIETLAIFTTKRTNLS